MLQHITKNVQFQQQKNYEICKNTGECDLQSEKKQKFPVRVLDVIFNGFKAAIINMCKELKETMLNEVKEAILLNIIYY